MGYLVLRVKRVTSLPSTWPKMFLPTLRDIIETSGWLCILVAWLLLSNGRRREDDKSGTLLSLNAVRIPKGESCKQKVSWQCNYVSVFIEIAQRNLIPLKKVNRMWDGWWEGKGRMGSSCSAQGREEGRIGVVGGEGWNKSHTRRTSISVTHRSEGEVLKNVNVVSLFSSINLVLWSIFKNNLII